MTTRARRTTATCARARALLALGVLVAVTFVGSAALARFSAPYRDDWRWLEWVLDGPSAARLFEPHNEHLIPLARALYWLQFTLEGSAGWLVFLAALGAQAGVIWIVVRQIGRRWPDEPDTGRAAIGLSLVALCFGWQLQSMVFAAAVLFPLAQLFATAAFAGTADALVGGRRSSLIVAAGASAAAMLTTTHGILVPLVAALLLAVRRGARTTAVGFAVLTAAGVAAYLSLAGGAAAAGANDAAARSLLHSATYALAFFAPSVTVASAAAGALVGTMLLLLGVAAVLAIVRSPDARRIEWFAAGTMLFVMASASLAAIGRADHGVIQSAQSRYATLTMAYWTALAVAVTSLVTRGHAWFVRLRRLSALAIPVALALVAVHAAACVVWIAKSGNIRAARLALVSGVEDDEWIASLDPDVWFVYDLAERARAAGDPSIVDDAIGQPPGPLPDVPPCDGALVLTATADGRALRLTGTLAANVSRGWIVDGEGIVRGLAAPAPIADEPAPTPPRVAALVLQAVRTGAWETDRWLGFASPGVGPYQFVGLDGTEAQCRTQLQLSASAPR